MAEPFDLSRRKALKLFAGVPMLPLGGLATASMLSACGGSDDLATPVKPVANFVSAAFAGMAAPTLADPAAMAKTTVASTLTVQLSDGSSRTFKLAYQPFFVTGDSVPNTKGGTILAGGYFDINNQPIVDKSVAGKERQFYSDCPDGSSLIRLDNPTVKGLKGNAVFAVVQFEYTTRDQSLASMYGQLPSPIAVLTLDQDPATGKLTLAGYSNVDTSKAHGLWITCGASLSPWNTHLSSEEYEPDATTIASNSQFKGFSRNLYGDETTANPYHYGHLPEVTVNPDGTGTIKKHYCLGRISHELIQVMPDKRTVLMGDDATNGGLFMFIADREADLSAGTLYVAKWTQVSASGAGAATLSWINLGHATSDEIEALANRLRANDIMDVATKDPLDPTYTKINYNGTFNWVRIKPGMTQAATFLETHRYAALAGGSMGFTKLEGTTVNIKDKVLYSAMSRIEKSMVRGNAASTDVAVDKTINAGAVYALNMKGGQRDRSGGAINSEWVPVDMAAPAALVGEDLSAPDALGNTANPERIANPDNLKFSEKLRTLFIGEDSGLHVNNFLWAYNVDTKTLARVLSCPAGAESTGLHAVDEINGWTYVMSNFQHVGDWESPLHDKVKSTLDPLVRANYKDRFGATVGYLTADPAAIKL
ncbi:PhoX family protein [Paraburkholderia aromaticivorans]|uniref:Alkaline phosphatase n=1 Tax=Paraburkholderia aromaticivorans TaxID=2026199 RepID=A0A248VRP3_9BURK|nr:alkaline phosphatase PhoX [Paraburkholderia aromaticivorans]ASW01671.1 alkaline phosphatase [Paraburkholderia aromaticivorans]